jgi:hypothetical protein
MPEVPRVGPQDILPEGSSKVALSHLQRVGLRGTVVVGCIGTAVICFLLVRWAWISPPVPVIPPGTDATIAKAMIENYKSLHDVALDATLRMFDSFVIKLLLPLFTSFVGYVFGSLARREG